ncbi:MAG: outer membrane beta-barrel family protein [Saprospiraceae bacterium]
MYLSRISTLLLFIFFAAGLLTAQDEALSPDLKGVVVDAESGAPVPFATVTLYASGDSALITGAITDDLGIFQIVARPGKHFLRIQYLSYETKFISGIRISKDKVADLGKVLLSPQSDMLDEVVIRADKSQVQFSLDKRIFNVGKDLVNRGGTAADVLDNVPSVTVDAEGGVSLRGSENVRILIDGRASGLVSFGSNGLRQLPANMIEKIEVITNPSARYEAQGMAGIINIVLKKEQREGVNGFIDVTTGTPNDHGAALNFNLRRNHFNFFTNSGLRYRKSPGSNSRYQEFYRGDTTFITDLTGERKRGGWSNNLRLGADYYFTEKSILTTAFSWRRSDENNLTQITYQDYLNDLSDPTGITRRSDDEHELEPNLEYSLGYKKTFEREGHELSADFRYQDNSEHEISDFRERYFSADDLPSGQADLIQHSDNKESERNMIFQFDYIHPFGKEGKWEAGLRSGIRSIRNDYSVEELSNGEWGKLPGLSNNVLYDESIHAAYGIVGNKHNKFSWQAGVRTELADVKTELLQTNEVNDRPVYINFFPSAHISYDLANESAVQLSYSRRIRRPGFRELNPFTSYSDARNYWGGNPNLDPEYTDVYELGYLKRWEKGSLTSSFYFRHTTNVIERIRQQLSDTVAFTRPANLSTRNNYGLEFTGSCEPFEFWSLNANLNFYRSITEGTYEGQSLDADTYTWSGRASSKLTLFDALDIQTTLNYRAPRIYTQGRSNAMYHIDLAAGIDVLKNNGTVTLSIRDLFNTRRWRGTTEGADFYTYGEFQWRARQITLSFSYRINRQKEQKGEREGERVEGMEF